MPYLFLEKSNYPKGPTGKFGIWQDYFDTQTRNMFVTVFNNLLYVHPGMKILDSLYECGVYYQR